MAARLLARTLVLSLLIASMTKANNHEKNILNPSQFASIFGNSQGPPPPNNPPPLPPPPPFMQQQQFQPPQQPPPPFMQEQQQFQPPTQPAFQQPPPPFMQQQQQFQPPQQPQQPFLQQQQPSFQQQFVQQQQQPQQQNSQQGSQNLASQGSGGGGGQQATLNVVNNCVPLGSDKLKQFSGHWYYFSWFDGKDGNRQLNWNNVINFCHRHCMDALDLESKAEFDFVASQIVNGDIYAAWTSGKYCPAGNCTSNDDKNLATSWIWTSSGAPVAADWSRAGGLGLPQPDNLVGRYNGDGPNEECLALLNNWYNDGVAWHDIMCRDQLPFVCKADVKAKSTPQAQPQQQPQPQQPPKPQQQQPIPYQQQPQQQPFGYQQQPQQQPNFYQYRPY